MPAAIGALVIVGVLVTAGFFMARQELRIGVASSFSTLAVNLAQQGANDVMINETSSLGGLSIWGTTTFSDTVSAGTWDVTATKLSTRLFFLDATGTVTKGGALWAGATRRVGVTVRYSSADVTPPAALTTQGSLKYGGSSEVHGIDELPNSAWSDQCDPATYSDMPGVLIDDTTNITWNGNRNRIEANMTGTPKFDQDTTISIESLMTFGDLSFDEMVAIAEKKYTSGPGSIGPDTLSNGDCDTSVKDNWGAPNDSTSDCFNYFPIIAFEGSLLQLTSGIGQGILLVDGDLKVTGGFEFYGPVFVKGTLTTMGSGGHFWGGVVAANADIATNTVLGNAVITFSSCAVTRAILNNSALTKVRPLAMRSWIDLSSVLN